MRMRGTWIVAAGIAGIALVLGVGAVMGQTPTDPAGTFVDRVAQKLGIEPDKLEQAIKDTRNEDIDARVQSGDLTQEEADALKARIDSGDGLGPFGGGRGHGMPGGPHGGGFAMGFGVGLPDQLDARATFLGIEQAQLSEELAADGATLATVAEAHGKSRDDLKTFLTDSAATKLAEAVTAGKLTQAQADEISVRTGGMLDRLIDGSFGAGRGERHFRFDFEFNGPDEVPYRPRKVALRATRSARR